jgi:hypothetical protein
LIFIGIPKEQSGGERRKFRRRTARGMIVGARDRRELLHRRTHRLLHFGRGRSRRLDTTELDGDPGESDEHHDGERHIKDKLHESVSVPTLNQKSHHHQS